MKIIHDSCVIIILELISLVNYHNALKLFFRDVVTIYCIFAILFSVAAAYL